MKSFFSFFLLAGIQAHTLFQKVSVNDVDQGFQFGVRDPDSNYPINSVDDPNFACNTGITHQDGNVITIPQGAKVGTFWNHQIGAGFTPGDDNSPIAPSHLGPIQVYLAAVPDAVSADPTGLQWFKVGAEGFNNGVWAVNNLINNQGWWWFTMPSCVPAGQYLMRAEIIALHGAFQKDAAQFYQECAQIEVTGPGTSTPATVSFPGAYSDTDPGILVSIYDGTGAPTMNGQPYIIPGPPIIDCSAAGAGSGNETVPMPGSSEEPSAPTATPDPTSGSSPTTAMGSAPTTMSTKYGTATKGKAHATGSGEAAPSPTSDGNAAEVPMGAGSAAAKGDSTHAGYLEQCGGDGYTGPTVCAQGHCEFANQWFSQCLP